MQAQVHGCGFERSKQVWGGHFQKTRSFTPFMIEHVDDCLSGIVACDAIYGEINILRSIPKAPFASSVASLLLKQNMHSLNGTASSLAGRILQTPCAATLPSQGPGSSQAFSQTPKTPCSTESSMHEYQKLGTISLELCSALVMKSIP